MASLSREDQFINDTILRLNALEKAVLNIEAQLQVNRELIEGERERYLPITKEELLDFFEHHKDLAFRPIVLAKQFLFLYPLLILLIFLHMHMIYKFLLAR